jgi:hypothetical protein
MQEAVGRKRAVDGEGWGKSQIFNLQYSMPFITVPGSRSPIPTYSTSKIAYRFVGCK